MNSPLHFVGFSRGTVVNSEIVQRLGTYFPEAGCKPGTGKRDLQMTTLDPHDFDQPGLSLLGINSFTDFREPKVQVWDHVTFADNYYQTVPNLLGNSFTPAGRDLPNLPATESGKTATGLEFPRQGWRSESPNPNAPLLGKPDLSVFLGTNKNEPDYERSRAGFTRETDPFYGFGGAHTRIPSWYAGTVELESVNFPNNEQSDEHGIYRQRSDGRYEQFFDRSFSYGEGVTNEPRVSPWYRPDHKQAGFNDSAEDAPSEGIGTGWFYSVLGGGKDLRPQTGVDKVPVDFDNTYDAHMRGDFAVPTLFNGNFDAVFNPKGTFRKSVSQEIPGWSFHGGESNSNNPTGSLVNWWDIPSLKEPRIIVGFEDGNPIRESYLQRLGIDSNSPANYALRLQESQSITHNRFIVPESGSLRFDLHVPDVENFTPGVLDNRLKVFISSSEPGATEYELSSRVIIKGPSVTSPRQADRQEGIEIGFDENPSVEDHHGNRIAFGSAGFETFHLDVPDELRGKPATLRFELEPDNPGVYLDNVFFQSKHLLFGNPTEARVLFDPNLGEAENDTSNDIHRQNYLVEKPQYALSYNDITKNPNWVSWQLNKSWLGSQPRTNLFEEDHTLPNHWQIVQGDGDINNGDAANRNSDGNPYDRGHMIPSGDRTRNRKDNYATFMMSNMLPQNPDNNQLPPPDVESIWSNNSWWKGLEFFSRQLVQDDRELYIMAGGTGTRAEILSQDGFLINVPERLWKVVLVLDEPGQNAADVTRNTMAFALDIPNINPADDVIETNSWRDYVISVRELENRLQEQPAHNSYDFLSKIPTEIQEIIENRPIGEIRAWINGFNPNP